MNLAVLQVFYPVFSGVIEGLAIANELIPFGSPFLALFCLSPLYIGFYKCKSYKEAFLLFFIQVLTVHLISSYWLANFHGFAIFTLGASAIATALQGGLMGIISYAYIATFKKDKALKEKFGTDNYSLFKRMIWFSAIWTLYEYSKSTGALGYPWGTLSMAAYKWKILTQIADITGVYGITFIYAISSCLLAEGINLLSIKNEQTVIKNYKQAFIWTIALFALSFIYGIYQYAIPRIPEKFFNAVLIQQNVDPWESGDKESIAISKKLTEKGIEQFNKNGKNVDLVVWSEGVLSRSFPTARFYYSRFPEDESLIEFINKQQVPFLIGGMTRIDIKKNKYSNSAILFDKNGSYSGFYSKIQLVPFAEKIPYYENPFMNYFMNNIVGMNISLTPGFQYVLFKIPLNSYSGYLPSIATGQKEFETIQLDSFGISNKEQTEKYISGVDPNKDENICFTTPICFEDAFPSICTKLYNMGSEVFLNITNDSWSKTTSSEIQHFIVASYLSIEYRTTLVRCANSGYTTVVDPIGRILADLPLFKEDCLSYSIPIFERRETIYSKYGDWFIFINALGIFIFMASVLCSIWLKDYVNKKILLCKNIIQQGKTIIDLIENNSKKEKKTISVKKAKPTKKEKK